MLRLARFIVPLLIGSVSLPACDSGDGGDSDDGTGDTSTDSGSTEGGVDASGGDGDSGDGDSGDGDSGDGDSGDGDSGDGDSGDGDSGDGDSGDGDSGDGDSGDGDSGDAHAEAACEQFINGTPTPVTSVMTQLDANQVVLTPASTSSYLVTLNENPEGGYIGWVNMSVPDWGSTQAIFVGPGVEYELFRNEGMTPISKEINLACPETEHSDERIFFPHWDDAQIRFTSTEQSEAWFMFFKQD